MKINKLLLLLLLISFSAFSQDVKELTLEIKNLEDGTGYCGNVYLETDKGLSQPFSCKNGNVQILFYEDTIQTLYTSIIIRQSNDCIANVNMDCLINSNVPIKLPKMLVEVKGFADIQMPTELSKILALLPNGSDETKLKPDLENDGGFFPKKVFRGINEQTKYLANWLAWQLQFLNEPIICNNYSNNVYRFTWVSNRCFYEYDPYSVRIEMQEDGSAILYCSSEHGNDNKGETEQYVFLMKSQHLENFIQQIDGIDLKGKTFADSIVNQNVLYILEANVDGQYHVIFRGEGEDPALDELQRFLWSLTGLGENKIVHRKIRIE